MNEHCIGDQVLFIKGNFLKTGQIIKKKGKYFKRYLIAHNEIGYATEMVTWIRAKDIISKNDIEK